MSVDRLNAEVERLRQAGVSLPRHPVRRAMAANDMSNMSRYANEHLGMGVTLGKTVTEEDYRQSMQLAREFGDRRASQARMQRTGGVGGDVGAAIPRFYDPLEYWDISGLPWNVANE